MSDWDEMYASDHAITTDLASDAPANNLLDCVARTDGGSEVDELEWDAPERIIDEGTSNGVVYINMSAATVKEREKRDAANKKRREREKRKRDEKKEEKNISAVVETRSKSKTDQELDGDSDDASASKKKKLKQDTSEQIQRVTAYIHVQLPTPKHPVSSRSKSKADAPPVSVRGPCFFTIDQTFNDFRAVIAKALPCKLKLLHSENVTWKYEKPANDTKKPLSSAVGYEAMIMSLAERKVNHVIQVFMPPPKADDAPWDTGDGDFVPKPYDHNDMVTPATAPPEDLSAKAQLARISGDADGNLARLQEQYPIGNCNLYPDFRILERSIGGRTLYWELTLLRLQIWANALSLKKSGVTLQHPPNSTHFDVSGCLKLKPEAKIEETPANPVATSAAPPNLSPVSSVPQYPYPSIPQLPTYPGAMPYGVPPWMYAPQQPFPVIYPPFPFPSNYPGAPTNYPAALQYSQQLPSVPGTAAALPSKDSPVSSPGMNSKLRVPLSDFCARYEISKTDEEKLALLEYKPGNNAVLILAPEDWKEVKFTTLGWKAFIDAHKQFLRDIKDGSWA
ncbi:hypothetical protein BDN70DRAFT_889159 [Pholiota conissans]|uniref:Uncharacterized protein n=1 Tax=Pholiota conissans TaxID=109636 RepID=A0A9P5YKH3_9AGAR|nr:hypothetical protein BDN70DRAFT_889159 [Pholiota conissans]